MSRIYNFSAGPAVLPLEVLESVKEDMVDYQGSGMSVMEMSHRGKVYSAIHAEAKANLKELLNLSDDYEILFVQGGASLQFSMVPMNFLGKGQVAEYVNSGNWASQAVKQARIIGDVDIVGDTEKAIPTCIPALDGLSFSDDAAYVHITTNETIAGSQWKTLPKTKAPLVADMSSDILSRPFDASDFSLFYAGAQKNLGPSGVTLVVIRKDFAEKANKALPAMLKYSTYIEKDSLYNTPPCFSIYTLMLVTRWMKKCGIENLYRRNVEKAAKLYAVIDRGDFYRGTAKKEYRSDMNVTFRLPTEDLEKTFTEEAAKAGLSGLKGHRSVGGIRASIYNAFPVEGVDALVDFMAEFEKRFG